MFIKNKDLITKLQQYDPELPVLICVYDNGDSAFEALIENISEVNYNNDEYYKNHDIEHKHYISLSGDEFINDQDE